jgi:Flp pilus assembly protein protease CpaA
MSEYQIYLLISLIPISYAIASIIPVVTTDIRDSRVPNKITVPLILINLVSMLGLAIWQGLWFRFSMVMLIAVVTLVIGSLVNAKEIIGMGDVKLFVALSMIIGWHSIGFGFAFLPITLVLGITIALVLLRFLRVAVLKISPLSYLAFIAVLLIIK